jgi:hypothetical protein
LNKTEKILTVVLIISHLLTELHSFLRVWLLPNIDNIKLSTFLEPGFVYPLALSWWIKQPADTLLNISAFICFAVSTISRRAPSYSFFIIICIFLVYHVWDMFAFFYNYKQTYGVFWMLLISCSVSAYLIAFPVKDKVRLRKV